MNAVVKQLCGKVSKKQVMVAYSEESVAARKMRVRGVATVEQSECLSLMTSGQFAVPEKKRSHYQGSNRGNILAWVKLPKWEGAGNFPLETRRHCTAKPVWRLVAHQLMMMVVRRRRLMNPTPAQSFQWPLTPLGTSTSPRTAAMTTWSRWHFGHCQFHSTVRCTLHTAVGESMTWQQARLLKQVLLI